MAALSDLGPRARAWFVARTKPNREDHAVRTLGLRGVSVFMPRIVEAECYLPAAGFRQPAPLFPGYLFVNVDLAAEYHQVIWAPGVRDLVSLGGAPVPVDGLVIDQIRLRCDAQGVVRVSPTPLNRGDRVEIADGPFAGLLATVETVMPRQRRIRLLVEFLARQTCVDLPLASVKESRPTWTRYAKETPIRAAL
jgi:transcription antitermination factor NusG